MGRLISDKFKEWAIACDERFAKLKENEEELNRIFIALYGLQDELTPGVEDKDITVHRAELQREIRSLLSYAVGCIFGRYSPDVEGLCYAGGTWDASLYRTVMPVEDNLLTLHGGEEENDIVVRVVDFVRAVYGEDTLEENLSFIAAALGGKGDAREVIRSYFISGFYADHLKVYRKRPIYWLFDSGKKNGFKALFYLHRYDGELLSRMHSRYVVKRYDSLREKIKSRINGLSSAEDRGKWVKDDKKLRLQLDELATFEKKLKLLADRRITLDLDDGVKVNYEKFGDLLAKIK